MKLVTFNIRYDNDQDGANGFRFRKPHIQETINREQPDVLCFQEVLPSMREWLQQALPDYVLTGCGREKGLDGEQVAVAFRKDRYDLAAMNTFWLSPTPWTPGSRYDGQSSCPRTCTEVVLAEHGSDRTLRILNTHLDHVGESARRQGVEQILRYADEAKLFPNAPIVLCGDFNAEPGAKEFQSLDARPDYACLVRNIGFTFHGYMRAWRKVCIDHIYLRGGLRCVGVEKWTQSWDDVYLSDHYPVCAEFEWLPAESR